MAQCGSTSNWAVLAEPDAGIARVDISATPISGPAWSGAELSFFATDNNIRVVHGTGIAPGVHGQSDPPLQACENALGIFGPADGTVVVLMSPREGFGLPVQDPNYYRWVLQEYGFWAQQGPDSGFTLSDCTIATTDAADTFGFDSTTWGTAVDSYTCIGSGVHL